MGTAKTKSPKKERATRLKLYVLPIILLGASVFLSILAVVVFVKTYHATEPIQFDTVNTIPVQSAEADDATKVVVDISGAVVNPGVYELIGESRVEDVLEMAGGFTNEVDTHWIARNMNRAAIVQDGMKIYVPTEGQDSTSHNNTSHNEFSTGNAASDSISGISINSSSQTMLESISGIGPVTAKKIISARPYGTIEELLSRDVVGQSLYEKIKNQLTL